MRCSVELLDDAVRRELDALPQDIRARFERITQIIESPGLERMREPYVKHPEGPA